LEPISEGETLSPIFAVVLAKVLHTLCGVPMVNYVIEAIRPLAAERLLVVVGHQAGLVEEVLPGDAEPVLQKEQLGTGDAVRVALGALEGEVEGVLLVVNGDGPLISDRTLDELVERHRSAGVGATVLVAELEDPRGLGRVVEDAGVVRIVEERDATEAERGINLVNLGLYAFELSEIRDAIGRLRADNGQEPGGHLPVEEPARSEPGQRPRPTGAGGGDPEAPHPRRPHEGWRNGPRPGEYSYRGIRTDRTRHGDTARNLPPREHEDRLRLHHRPFGGSSGHDRR
jgi:CTP:molybdopterin cytidylyltransferase MocA